MFELPPRKGPRPRTTPCAPHTQVSQNPAAATLRSSRSPMAEAGGNPPAEVMVFASRDEAEINTALKILATSCDFARGKLQNPEPVRLT